jgi:four helix bundle protein
MQYSFAHEQLDCYRLAVEVNRWFDQAVFPAGRAHLKDQGLRASDSVVCNIAEGCARRGTAAGRNSLRIALGSAGECCAVLDLVSLTGAREQQQKLRRVGAMLFRLSR